MAIKHPNSKHGNGFFGDIDSKAKAFARKHKDLINPIINRVKSTVHGGIDKLSNKAKEKLEEPIQPIEGEGVKRRRGRPKKGARVIGDVLKGLIDVIDLGVVKPKRLRKGEGVIGDVLKGLIGSTGLGVVKPKRLQKGKGLMSDLFKTVVPGAIDDISKKATSVAKDKVSTIGSGSKRKTGRPRKVGRPKGRGGGTLFPEDNYGPNA